MALVGLRERYCAFEETFLVDDNGGPVSGNLCGFLLQALGVCPGDAKGLHGWYGTAVIEASVAEGNCDHIFGCVGDCAVHVLS